jgi:hypothetical protein
VRTVVATFSDPGTAEAVVRALEAAGYVRPGVAHAAELGHTVYPSEPEGILAADVEDARAEEAITVISRLGGRLMRAEGAADQRDAAASPPE